MLLAAVVARRTALPLRIPLRRIRPASPQVALDRAARAENLRGAYVAEAGALHGARVALVDDVATTGATLAAATGALRAAGARAVRSYVIALDA
jgi:predicted amidophosphoribosyltransferase